MHLQIKCSRRLCNRRMQYVVQTLACVFGHVCIGCFMPIRHIYAKEYYVHICQHCSWTLTMGLIGCIETSVRIYHYRLLPAILGSRPGQRYAQRVGKFTLVKKIQPDAQLVFITFRQPLHVSGVSKPIIRRYNRVYTAIGTYCSF